MVLWIIGILKVLAETEFKFSSLQYWDQGWARLSFFIFRSDDDLSKK